MGVRFSRLFKISSSVRMGGSAKTTWEGGVYCFITWRALNSAAGGITTSLVITFNKRSFGLRIARQKQGSQ